MMPEARVLRASGYRRMPWKNGGGETREIMVHPASSGLDDFGWRVSMAHIGADGPFSVFPGVDRTLAILHGNGIRLSVGSSAPVELKTSSPPFAFAADVEAAASLIDGPVTDLNVMTRRGRFRHRVGRIRPGAVIDQAIDAATVLFFCGAGNVDVHVQGDVFRLGPCDALLAGAGAMRIVPDGRPVLHMVEIDPAA